MQHGEFVVDLKSGTSVSETLKGIMHLLDDGDRVARILESNGDLLPLTFGTLEEDEFREFPPPRWSVDSPAGRPLSLTSTHTFFYAAAQFDIPGIIEETLLRMGDSQLMEAEAAPLGSYAFGGLMRASAEWAHVYGEYLKGLARFDMFNDTEEVDGIAIAVQTHGWTEDTLGLLAIRMFPCQGQGGGEAFQIFRDEYGLNDALEDEELEGAFDGALRREIEDLEEPGLETFFWSCGYDPHGGMPAPGEAATPCDEIIWTLIREYLVIDDEDDYY
jgi:hypothetical protein